MLTVALGLHQLLAVSPEVPQRLPHHDCRFSFRCNSPASLRSPVALRQAPSTPVSVQQPGGISQLIMFQLPLGKDQLPLCFCLPRAMAAVVSLCPLCVEAELQCRNICSLVANLPVRAPLVRALANPLLLVSKAGITTGKPVTLINVLLRELPLPGRVLLSQDSRHALPQVPSFAGEQCQGGLV